MQNEKVTIRKAAASAGQNDPNEAEVQPANRGHTGMN